MERAEHLQQVLGAVLDYVGAIVADTDHVAPAGSIDGKYLLGLISDVAGDVAGSISKCGGRPRGGEGSGEGNQAATMRSLLACLLVDPLAEPDARPASIIIDEFDTSGFERVANR